MSENDQEYGELDDNDARPRGCRRIAARSAVGLAVLVVVVVGCVFLFRGSPPPSPPPRSLNEYCAAFVADSGPLRADAWEGTFEDLFSPDDKNPASRRFVDLRRAKMSGRWELEISADTGTERWGRRFFVNTTVNPCLIATEISAQRKTSFLSKIPTNAAVYPDALNGALNFTVTIGRVNGKRVFRWNGLYDGKGGPWENGIAAPSACKNFWAMV
jgi:hypothetical protein